MNKKGRVLIAEDEEDLRESLVEAVSEIAVQVDFAADGEKAIEIFLSKKTTYDAILSDINMPRLNGIGFLRKIRESGSEVPFVILTGHGDKELAVQALKLGAFDFLDKPCKTDKVNEVMAKAIELGTELNRWSDEGPVTEALLNAGEEKSEESATRLLRALGKKVRENLQKRNKKS